MSTTMSMEQDGRDKKVWVTLGVIDQSAFKFKLSIIHCLHLKEDKDQMYLPGYLTKLHFVTLKIFIGVCLISMEL